MQVTADTMRAYTLTPDASTYKTFEKMLDDINQDPGTVVEVGLLFTASNTVKDGVTGATFSLATGQVHVFPVGTPFLREFSCISSGNVTLIVYDYF